MEVVHISAVPLFTGSDLGEWSSKLQDFFKVYRVEEDMKLPLARLRIANSDRLLSGMQYTTFSELLVALKSEFSSREEDLCDQFFRASQGPSESVTSFGRRLSQLHTRAKLPASLLRKYFVGGLLPDIAYPVDLSCPATFDKALDRAKYREEAMLDAGAKLAVPALHVEPPRPQQRDHGARQQTRHYQQQAPHRQPFPQHRQQQQQQPQQQNHQHNQQRAAPAVARAPVDTNALASQMSKLSLQYAQILDQQAQPSLNFFDATQAPDFHKVTADLRTCLLDTHQQLL